MAWPSYPPYHPYAAYPPPKKPNTSPQQMYPYGYPYGFPLPQYGQPYGFPLPQSGQPGMHFFPASFEPLTFGGPSPPPPSFADFNIPSPDMDLSHGIGSTPRTSLRHRQLKMPGRGTHIEGVSKDSPQIQEARAYAPMSSRFGTTRGGHRCGGQVRNAWGGDESDAQSLGASNKSSGQGWSLDTTAEPHGPHASGHSAESKYGGRCETSSGGDWNASVSKKGSWVPGVDSQRSTEITGGWDSPKSKKSNAWGGDGEWSSPKTLEKPNAWNSEGASKTQHGGWGASSIAESTDDDALRRALDASRQSSGHLLDPNSGWDASPPNAMTNDTRISNVEKRVSALELISYAAEKAAPELLNEHLVSLGTAILDLGFSHPSYDKMSTSFLATLQQLYDAGTISCSSALYEVDATMCAQRSHFGDLRKEQSPSDSWGASSVATPQSTWGSGGSRNTSTSAENQKVTKNDSIVHDFKEKNDEVEDCWGATTSEPQSTGWGASLSQAAHPSTKHAKVASNLFDVNGPQQESDYGTETFRDPKVRRTSCFRPRKAKRCGVCGFGGHRAYECHVQASEPSADWAATEW